MLTLLIAVVAAHANPWIDKDADVVAEATISAPRDQVYEHLLDVRHLEPLLASCTSNWTFGGETVGLGAEYGVRWDIAMMRRSLSASVVAADTPKRIDLDHVGDRGFVTRLTLTEQGAGTKVVAHSYIGTGPWPLRRYYFTRIRPKWVQCWNDALVNLEGAVGTR